MSYVGPAPENPCPPGQGQTFTEELGRHCVDLIVQHVDKLPATGGDGGWVDILAAIAGGLVLVGLAFLLGSWLARHGRE